MSDRRSACCVSSAVMASASASPTVSEAAPRSSFVATFSFHHVFIASDHFSTERLDLAPAVEAYWEVGGDRFGRHWPLDAFERIHGSSGRAQRIERDREAVARLALDLVYDLDQRVLQVRVLDPCGDLAVVE